MSGTALLERQDSEHAESLWEIKRARALDRRHPDPCDLEAEFAAYAAEASEWASDSTALAGEILSQD
jgi:hypothetical protein